MNNPETEVYFAKKILNLNSLEKMEDMQQSLSVEFNSDDIFFLFTFWVKELVQIGIKAFDTQNKVQPYMEPAVFYRSIFFSGFFWKCLIYADVSFIPVLLAKLKEGNTLDANNRKSNLYGVIKQLLNTLLSIDVWNDGDWNLDVLFSLPIREMKFEILMPMLISIAEFDSKSLFDFTFGEYKKLEDEYLRRKEIYDKRFNEEYYRGAEEENNPSENEDDDNDTNMEFYQNDDGGKHVGLDDFLDEIENKKIIEGFKRGTDRVDLNIIHFKKLQRILLERKEFTVFPEYEWFFYNSNNKIMGIARRNYRIQKLVQPDSDVINQLLEIDPELSLRENQSHIYELQFGANGSKIPSFPECILKLNNLDELTIFNNVLESIPESIGNLQSLRHLDLSHNKLKSVPKNIGLLKSLEWLDLSSNFITSIPLSIGKLRKIRYLDVRDNPLKFASKVFIWIMEHCVMNTLNRIYIKFHD